MKNDIFNIKNEHRISFPRRESKKTLSIFIRIIENKTKVL